MPVAQQPLILYVLRWLGDAGIADVTVCANSSTRAVREQLANGASLDLALKYYEDHTPRGAAGCARDAALGETADTFVSPTAP